MLDLLGLNHFKLLRVLHFTAEIAVLETFCLRGLCLVMYVYVQLLWGFKLLSVHTLIPMLSVAVRERIFDNGVRIRWKGRLRSRVDACLRRGVRRKDLGLLVLQ